MVCIRITLHLISSVQSLSSFLPALRKLSWCVMTWRGRSLWRACQPPGVALIRGAEQGTSCAEEKDPQGDPAQCPLPCNPQTANPVLFLHWQIIQHHFHNDMKISFIGHSRPPTCCVLLGAHVGCGCSLETSARKSYFLPNKGSVNHLDLGNCPVIDIISAIPQSLFSCPLNFTVPEADISLNQC